MAILKRAQKQEVHWTLPWNIEDEANIKLHQLLGQLDCHFCKNIVTAGGYVWEIAGTGWNVLADAPTEDRACVQQELGHISRMVIERLKTKLPNAVQAQSFADKIMSVPNEEYIFYRFSDGKLNVVLAAWGFKNYKKPSTVINRKAVEGRSMPVRIGFRKDGQLLKNHPFAIIRQTVNELQTGEDGYFVLGDKLKVGSVFNILCRVSKEQFLLTVNEGQSDYFFEVKTLETKVIPQETIVLPITETVQEVANENEVDVKEEEALIQEVSSDVEEKISQETETVKIPDLEEEEGIVESEPTEEFVSSDVTIQLVDKNRHAVPKANMHLKNHKGEECHFMTNGDGCIFVPFAFFANNKKVKVLPHVENMKVKACKLKFKSSCNFYIIELKEPRNWKWLWWLLLLLLPLLLLIRCEHDIKVTCIDKRTDKPIEGVDISLDYTAHFLYDNGKFFSDKEHSYQQYTDKSGNTIFKDLECSVYSYLFYFLSQVNVVAEEDQSYNGLFHFTRHVVFELENVDCEVDIVMCIDNTGSMSGLLDMVKSNAMNFHSDLKKYCKEKRRNLNKVRLKVISFGDLKEEPIKESAMFLIPKEKEAFDTYVRNIECHGGGDTPENGLEALAMAINTDWVQSDIRYRHIVIVYTDAPAHELDNPLTHTSYYPANIPRNLLGLRRKWNRMDEKAKRLVLFAPLCYPWEDIASSWDEVAHKTENLNEILSGDGYEDILEAICKSL